MSSAVIIDNGTGFCKSGMSGEDAPRTKFPTVVGTHKLLPIMAGTGQQRAFIGQEAVAKKGVLLLKQPIENGIITDWEGMIKVWHHVYFNELRVTPEEHPCLLTETPKNPKKNKENITRYMFEVFNVPSLFVAIQSVLSLYSSGRTTGIVLDSGAGVTSTVPSYEGYAMGHAIERSNFAGKQLTRRMHSLLEEAGMNFSYSSEYTVLEDIKDKHSYVAQDYEAELSSYEQRNRNDCMYTLPDGQSITLGNQRFRCGEALFSPDKLNLQMAALHEMIYQSIMKCDIDVRKDLYTNIVLSGGSTMMPGFSERLFKEMEKLVPANIKIKVVAPPDRQYLSWIGGSILSSLSTFQAMWISKIDYNECGESIIHKKCF